jgi:hypothetical protein
MPLNCMNDLWESFRALEEKGERENNIRKDNRGLRLDFGDLAYFRVRAHRSCTHFSEASIMLEWRLTYRPLPLESKW